MTSRMALLGLIGLLAGCQSVHTEHNADPQAPFASYKTFAWVTEEPLIKPAMGATAGGRAPDPLLDPIIRQAVERNLQAKGYQKVTDPAQADLVLSFSIGARDKIEVDSYPVSAGYAYGGRWGGYGGGGYSTSVDTYTEGVLALDFFEQRSKRAVWHGFATKRLSSSAPTPEKRRETVNLVVDAILEEFPVRGGSATPAS